MSRLITIISVFLSTAALTNLSAYSAPISAPTPLKSSSAYWLWAGHKVQNFHSDSVLYLHQGHVKKPNAKERGFLSLGFSPHKIKARSLYVVIRMDNLLYDTQFILALVRRIKRWESRGNKVEGLQLDFDSSTLKLLKYSNYLKFVRATLPVQYKLSITGLADWLVSGQQHVIAISQSVDEIVFQLYQYKTAHKNLKPYFLSLKSSGIHFKLGLVQRGKYNKRQLRQLTGLPNYRGSVIFTLK